MKEVTKEQIKAWKEKYGDIFQVQVENKTCFLHKPDRKTIAYALTKVQTNPLEFNEILLKNCWIDGDEEIRTNDDLFFAVSSQLEKILEQKQAEIKKL